MDKAITLQRRKYLALSLLCLALLLFLSTFWLPPSWAAQALKATSEAAMVGGLADWFAVTALFHRIPLFKHSRIIPRNKQKIGENLGLFIEEKFLNPTALSELIQRYDPASQLQRWLLVETNPPRLSSAIRKMLLEVVNASQDQALRDFTQRLVGKTLEHWDLRAMLIKLLESSVRDNRHQKLLDNVLTHLAKWLENSTTRHRIASHISNWFKQEYPTASWLVSSQWFGEKGADKITQIIEQLLSEVAHDPHHHLRNSFNHSVRRFIYSLNRDPAMAEQVERLKVWLKNDPALTHYLAGLTADLRHWFARDLRSSNSRIDKQLQKIVRWLGQQLARDPQLVAVVNRYLQQTATRIGPSAAAFISRHIRDTLHRWDDRQLVEQIELNIGADLQVIRINGTLVGGIIGLLLFLISQFLPVLLHSVSSS